ncbi:hypothetical protein M9H77_19902 [Catharanthus roseus]|uniref:Uncharacterized protein n=1 Tax=Catharanthus roseus TaxID=4058 RepID=A0ACC0BBN1_CATRO|nr:hypothetical protein M9H77_19902 [Catharanthus roseus]
MENREDLKSIIPFLPLILRSSSLFWQPPILEALKALSKGPEHSNVDSGRLLALAISDLTNSFSFSPHALQGYSLFFDDLMPKDQATRWFKEVLPKMADLLLKLPSLLESHYQTSAETRIRMLEPQQPGLVLLSQELIAALLACSFFCLFPDINRGAKNLPTINFDDLFACLNESYEEQQESKIKCIVHYFERISSCMPTGNVSFERKVLPLQQKDYCISYPRADFWSNSNLSLCPFEVDNCRLIEDHQCSEALEVDFANQFLGGGALRRGCVQEEIRFMINPELIVGMLFLPAMATNEAIEIVGSERFSSYTGYASSFRFSGDYVDQKDVDYLGRRKTRVIAVDALCSPGKKQYQSDFLLREINKAFSGFFYQHKCQQYQELFQDDRFGEFKADKNVKGLRERFMNDAVPLDPSSSSQRAGGDLGNQPIRSPNYEGSQSVETEDRIGIVTGNWGCGAFGGDPEVKAIIQWLAASQALRPFIMYHTFGMKTVQSLDQVTQWIISQDWTVGELWNMLVEYGLQRFKGRTEAGFFSWLLPSMRRPTMAPWGCCTPHLS